ncbi:MAG: family 20 glycosylhydrolase [Victivallaceae bacterium]|nr:family 20 glycosylhydrolase [Victivallaceae bacterium]
MNKYMEEVLLARLIPAPCSIKFGDAWCVIADGLPVMLKTVSPSARLVAAADGLCRSFWNCSPAITAVARPESAALADEEYRIAVKPGRIEIAARGAVGVRHAFNTLRQLAEAGRGAPGAYHYVLPACLIEDAPKLPFRAVHLCIFPETPMWFVEKQLRLAAYHKFNFAIIEPWGVFPFESHPEFGWREKMKSREEFRRLLDVAAECRIVPIPQFNIFGHAGMARAGTGKHAVLDLNRGMEPLFEPAGWSFCLSNPETRRVLRDLVVELFTFFGRPSFFHIGCDEAYDFQTCRECAAADPVKLLSGHIGYFHELLGSMGARVIMWHDMLLEQGDPRWKDCTACGDARTAELYKVLPKNIVIADWQYFEAPKDNPDREWPTSLFFKEQGFDVAACCWMDRAAIGQLGAMAARHRLFGMIGTTWNTNSGYRFEPMFIDAPFAAWCGRIPEKPMPLALAAHLRQIGWDMGITEYAQTGHTPLQIADEPFLP